MRGTKGLRTARAAAAAIGVTLAFAGVAATAQAESPADWLYEPTTFNEIDLTLPPSSVQELEEHPEDEYVPGTFSIAETDGAPGTAGAFSTPLEVGIRLKGSFGSGVGLDQKAAFKIKFDFVVEGQTFDGLEKMTLNNMVQDPSMTHETLAYDAFRSLGVKAPHTGFTYLRVNGESYGLHLDLETQDKVALEKEFGPFEEERQHLYEGEEGADATEAILGRTGEPAWEALEVDEGRKKHKEDLEALVGAVETSGPSFSERVSGLADLPEMTRAFATEKYIGHGDGYSGEVLFELPNNYYLYSDVNGEFQLLPWGTDQTWTKRLPFEGPASGVLYAECVADASGCRPIYRAALGEALATLPALGLDRTARCLAESLSPWQEYEAAESDQERLPYTVEEMQEGAQDVRDFIAERPAELASFLGVAVPSPPAEPEDCPPLRPIGGFVAPGPPASTPAPSTSTSSHRTPTTLRLGRFSPSDRRIVLRLTVSGPGSIAATGTYRFGGKQLKACAGRRAVDAAGPAALTCRLTPGFRRRLEKGPLRVHLAARFTSAGGAAASASRTLRLRRG
jgi:CotH kinase protein